MEKKGKGKKKNFKKIKKKERKIKEVTKKKEPELEKHTLEKIMIDTGFNQNLQPIEIPAPVLERVEIPTQEQLESNISSTPIVPTKETGTNYVTGNEPKYLTTTPTNNSDERKYETGFRTPNLTQPEFQRPQDEFVASPLQAKDQENEHIKFFEQKNNLFETQEKKYDKVNV